MILWTLEKGPDEYISIFDLSEEFSKILIAQKGV